MERTKYIITIIILFLSVNSLCGEYKKEIYEAYVRDDMDKWKEIIDIMIEKENKSDKYRFEMINYQYGYIAWCLGHKKKDRAEVYIDIMQRNVDILKKKKYKLSMMHAYQAALYGFEIGMNFLNAPVLGPKSNENAKTALELDKHNPCAYIQFGNSKFYTPAILGGSKSVAILYYKRALKEMESNPERIKNDWNYINLLTVIAQAYMEIEKYEIAKKYYEKILKIEPDFIWVKKELLPELLKKMK